TPMHYRIDGELVDIDGKILTKEDAKKTIYSILDGEQIKKFEAEKELDFSISIESYGRYRCNIFLQMENVGCAIRLIPFEIRTIEECGLPADVVRSFCRAHRGLVLITGATGSGKSTTLASMVNEINETRGGHIITVEDPIEYVHNNKKAIIEQRQVYEDTHSFANALKYVLRQDPDVILIGELRDLDTIQQALVIADTGHLVLGTLHTSDATQTINRIVDVFPAHQQKQIRTQLSFVLVGVVSQQLVPLKAGTGRVLATELLIANSAVKSLIRYSKEYQIYSVIQTSQKYGMKTMNQSLAELCRLNKIDREEAVARATDVEELLKLLN
ncbi:MAG: type IV pilus twitching motility protein PilT, partial [Candidatus Omnitrophota bacterium]